MDYEDYIDVDYGALPLVQQQEFLYGQLGLAGYGSDYEAERLFREVMYNDELSESQRYDLYDELVQYIWDEYGINFGDVWDWEAFREWYESV